MSYCAYYQVTINRKLGWFVASTMRSFEHLAFERSFNAKAGINEYFVPTDQEKAFLNIVQGLADMGVITKIEKVPNRLMDPTSSVML